MPFKSQAQRAFMYSQHPAMAKKWEAETPKGKLPEHVGKHGKNIHKHLAGQKHDGHDMHRIHGK